MASAAVADLGARHWIVSAAASRAGIRSTTAASDLVHDADDAASASASSDASRHEATFLVSRGFSLLAQSSDPASFSSTDGRIAVVWTRYDFHRDGKMSHNGTDCFTLLKTDAGWKIVCLAYSVEPATQTENPAGPPH